jgi:hypothetical protein
MSRRDDLLIWAGVSVGIVLTLLLAALVWFG